MIYPYHKMVEVINLEGLAAAASHANLVAKGKERAIIKSELKPPSFFKMMSGHVGRSHPTVGPSTDSNGESYKYTEYTSIIREALYKGMGAAAFPGDIEYITKLRQSRDLGKALSHVDIGVYNPLLGGSLAAGSITLDHYLSTRTFSPKGYIQNDLLPQATQVTVLQDNQQSVQLEPVQHVQ
jgi:hypothetical protein